MTQQPRKPSDLFRHDALDFAVYAFKEVAFRRQLATFLPRGDLESLRQLARSLGFNVTTHDLTLALEIRIKRLLKTDRLTEEELIELFDTPNWIDRLRDLQRRSYKPPRAPVTQVEETMVIAAAALP